MGRDGSTTRMASSCPLGSIPSLKSIEIKISCLWKFHNWTKTLELSALPVGPMNFWANFGQIIGRHPYWEILDPPLIAKVSSSFSAETDHVVLRNMQFLNTICNRIGIKGRSCVPQFFRVWVWSSVNLLMLGYTSLPPPVWAWRPPPNQTPQHTSWWGPGDPPPTCEQNDRQVQKYYLAPNFVCRRSQVTVSKLTMVWARTGARNSSSNWAVKATQRKAQT